MGLGPRGGLQIWGTETPATCRGLGGAEHTARLRAPSFAAHDLGKSFYVSEFHSSPEK